MSLNASQYPCFEPRCFFLPYITGHLLRRIVIFYQELYYDACFKGYIEIKIRPAGIKNCFFKLMMITELSETAKDV